MKQRSLATVCGVCLLVLACAAPASAQQGTPPSTPTINGPTTSSSTGTTTGGGFLGLSLGNLFGGFITPTQDEQLLATAMAEVQAIGQIIPLSTDEEMFLVFILYEIEKINAIMTLFSGGSTMPSNPGGP